MESRLRCEGFPGGGEAPKDHPVTMAEIVEWHVGHPVPDPWAWPEPRATT